MLGIRTTVETDSTAFENEAKESQGSTLLDLFDIYVYSESGVMQGQPTWHIQDATLRHIRQLPPQYAARQPRQQGLRTQGISGLANGSCK